MGPEICRLDHTIAQIGVQPLAEQWQGKQNKKPHSAPKIPKPKAEEKHTQVETKRLLSIQCCLHVAIGWLNFIPNSLGPGPWAQPPLFPSSLSLTLLYLFTLYIGNSSYHPSDAPLLSRMHGKTLPLLDQIRFSTIQVCWLPATPHTENIIFLSVAKPFLPWIFQPSFVAVSSKSSPPEKS